MGLPLRITFNDKDYNFQIVKTEPITRSTKEISILIESETINLVKEDAKWTIKEPSDLLDINLLEAIGKAIGLRYRV